MYANSSVAQSYLCCLENKLRSSIISSKMSLELQQLSKFFINLKHTRENRQEQFEREFFSLTKLM